MVVGGGPVPRPGPPGIHRRHGARSASRQTARSVLRVFQNPKVVVSVVFVAAMFMNILDTTIVNTTIPAIGADFGTSVSSTGAVASAYLVSIAVVIS